MALVLRPSSNVGVLPAELPPVTLGTEFLWPDARMEGSTPEKVATAFATDVLRWTNVSARVVPWNDVASADVLVDSPDAAEPLHVVVMNGGWVSTVAPSSTVAAISGSGVSLSVGTGIAGVRINVAVLSEADFAEVTIKLVDGRQFSVWVGRGDAVRDEMRIDLPDQLQEDVASVLVRYVGHGRVLSAAGGSFNTSTRSDSALTLSVVLTTGDPMITAVVIHNQGATEVDLTGWRLETVGYENLGFTFPPGTLVQPASKFGVHQVRVTQDCPSPSPTAIYLCYSAFGGAEPGVALPGSRVVLRDASGTEVASWTQFG